MGPSSIRVPGWATLALSVILAVLLLTSNVLLSVHGPSTNLELYRDLWEEHNVPSGTGMSMEDLSLAGSSLIGYFTGRLESPQVSVTISGEERDLYNAKELEHLVDVRNLFRYGLTVEWISIAAAASVTATLLAAGKRKAASLAFYAAGALSILAVLLLAIPAAADFYGWWTNFHLLTFTNDLWLLDPETDWLIRMFPQPFFFSMVQRIGIHTVVTGAVLVLAGAFLGRARKMEQHR